MGLAGHDAAVSGVCLRAYILAVTQAGVPRLRCNHSAASMGLQPFVNQKYTLLIKRKGPASRSSLPYLHIVLNVR